VAVRDPIDSDRDRLTSLSCCSLCNTVDMDSPRAACSIGPWGVLRKAVRSTRLLCRMVARLKHISNLLRMPLRRQCSPCPARTLDSAFLSSQQSQHGTEQQN